MVGQDVLDVADDGQVGADQVVARLAGLAGDARGDDEHVGAGHGGTQVVTVKIYDYLFGLSNVGAASALSMVLAGILAVMLFIYFRWFYVEEV